jgi:tRNA uridine 5-carboxymethylaminomethyl modification enzyme
MDVGVVVVGGGHAGVEACLSSARMGVSTVLVTVGKNSIGRMSCNPAIGGIAKGQLVREIDALGGQMGLTADATGIHFRMLNTSKGPAVQSPRCQSDKYAYAEMMQAVILNSEVQVVEGMVSDLLMKDGGVAGVRLVGGQEIRSSKVIITTGTFMNGLIHRGSERVSAGRVDEPPSLDLPLALKKMGFETRRLKTGTPPRVRGASIDHSLLEVQEGDEKPTGFSFLGGAPAGNRVHCHIAWTTPESHRLILDNISELPLYNGQIEGVGPRYCPSIEDKVCRFKDRERHQVFIEPESLTTDEVYLNGISTSMSPKLQDRLLSSIPGLEKAEVLRYGYAIEYDFVPPHQLRETMETIHVPGLYLAGQINGTTGYEEAAAQGLMAGINAVLSLREEEPFVLRRDEAYIGVLMDDLVIKEITEPYRMFTSRAEHRLLLRHDNADQRLMGHGKRLGLLADHHYDAMCQKVQDAEEAKKTLGGIYEEGKSYLDMLKNPRIKLEDILRKEVPSSLEGLSEGAKRVLEVEVKYEGYLKREEKRIQRMNRADDQPLPLNINYNALGEMRQEGREKLSRFRPRTLGQASRIAGVNPADLQILEVYMKRGKWPLLRGEASS